jgi:DNA-binding CsgD family transcriptional regulator
MAACKSSHEERDIRRAAMLSMRKRGLSYEAIGRKFNISKNSARVILLRMYKLLGTKDIKEKRSETVS